MGRDLRVNGGQLLDVTAGMAAQVKPGRYPATTGRVHTS